MQDKDKKISKFIHIIVFIVLIIPLVLNWIIGSNEFFTISFNTNMSKDAWLSFWASYIGGIFTIIALVLTVLYNQTMIRKQQKINKLENEFVNKIEFATKVKDVVLLIKYKNNFNLMDYKVLIILQFDVSILTEQINDIINDSIVNTDEHCFYSEIDAVIKKLLEHFEELEQKLKPLHNNFMERSFDLTTESYEKWSKESLENINLELKKRNLLNNTFLEINKMTNEKIKDVTSKYNKYINELQLNKDNKVIKINKELFWEDTTNE